VTTFPWIGFAPTLSLTITAICVKRCAAPFVVNAETRGASLQILPNRLQAAVTEVRDLKADAQHLVDMVQPVFDYVGVKSLTAVGHNAQYTLGAVGDRHRIYGNILNVSAISKFLGEAETMTAADVHLYSYSADRPSLRVIVQSSTDADSMFMDFNVNFDLAAGHDAREAIERLPESLDRIRDVAERADSSFLRSENPV
jgi:hypothetical protein